MQRGRVGSASIFLVGISPTSETAGGDTRDRDRSMASTDLRETGKGCILVFAQPEDGAAGERPEPRKGGIIERVQVERGGGSFKGIRGLGDVRFFLPAPIFPGYGRGECVGIG